MLVHALFIKNELAQFVHSLLTFKHTIADFRFFIYHKCNGQNFTYEIFLNTKKLRNSLAMKWFY